MPATYCQNGPWTYTSAATTNYIPAYQLTNNSTTMTTWINWNQPTITYTSSFQEQIWQEWVTSVNTSSGQYQQRILTPDELREHDRRREEERRVRSAACTRARVLLGEFLDDEQKAELERKGQFHVTGSKGRRYCIRTEGQSGNVDLLKPDGSIQARLCCHPRNYLPDGDAWLMQMIEIRHDEDHFLATANVHQGRLPVAV